MPARVTRSATSLAAPKKAKNKNRKRTLDAFAIASHSVPEKQRGAKHRLGETLDDGPMNKRGRVDDGEEEDEEAKEDAPSAKKRGRGRDGEVEEGSDSSGNEWTMGGLAEGDEDSDLDSDEAFGESDEERFEAFTFRGSHSKGKKAASRKNEMGHEDIDLNERAPEEVDEEDDLGDDAVDLAQMLDESDDEVLSGRHTIDLDKGKQSDSNSDKSSGASDEDSEAPSTDSEDDDNADQLDESKLSKFQDFIESLPTGTSSSKSRQPREREMHESMDPTPFAIKSKTKLKLSDLLPSIKDMPMDPSARKTLQALAADKPSIRKLRERAPLPKRQQDKLEREVALKKAKEQLDRWRDTVMHNRRAEFLQFPLKDPHASQPLGEDKMLSTANGKPANELEAQIQAIMEESGLAATRQKGGDEEADIMAAEELQTNKLSLEDVLRRRTDLRRQRELLFREEIKAKRISKIKSKAYRRVHRKERDRLALTELAGDEDIGEGEREKQDRRRAEERMGRRHRESRWAKAVKRTGQAAWDEGAREGVAEMARRDEELRKRIAGKEIVDSDASEAPSEGDVEGESGEDEDGTTMRRLDELDAEREGGGSGLQRMKFMRASDDRKRKRNDEDVRQLKRELAGEESPSEDDGDGSLGRAIFGPRPMEGGNTVQAKAKRPELEEGDVSGDEGVEQRGETEAGVVAPNGGKIGGEAKKPKGILKTGFTRPPMSKTLPERDKDEPNTAWLAGPARKGKRDKQRARDAEGAGVVLTTIAAEANSNASSATKAVEEDNNDAVAKSSDAPNTTGWTTVPYNTGIDDNGATDHSDPEHQDPILTQAQQRAAYHARAFAGDDVALHFADEKSALTASEDAQQISHQLPGWGSWTGTGLSKSHVRHAKRIAHNPLYKTALPGTQASQRRDARLANVIVSERATRNKGGGKYLARALPHGFEARTQYERSLRLPVGPEWTTKATFQRATRPRVVVRQGVVGAMERPLL